MTTTNALATQRPPRGTDARLTMQAHLRGELSRANAVIEKAGAVRTEDDGFRWVDESQLPADFVSYYQGLTSTCYAFGAI